ncbi:MAG TPA: YgjV family protein [Flavisolibacter sp.]|jgi:ribosomal protein S18 acetylase RimI-like enzyme|nr:YgjV family protein [Flavisolibacter sp.]
MSQFIIEGIGYLASLLLALSLIAANNLRFRWLNTGGCLAFIVYGIMIGAFPIILTNALLFIINVFALVKIYRKKEDFELLEFKPDATLIAKFLRFYEADLKTYFPHFRLEENSNDVRFVVLRNMELANVFVATPTEDGTAFVKCNYTIPKFRDYKVGRFIFEKEREYLPAKGIRKLVYTEVANPGHREFLERMGFRKEENESSIHWVKYLA